MANDNYVEAPKNQSFKKAIGAIKEGYKYLHPDYWKRKLVHLVLVMPIVFFIDAILIFLQLDYFKEGSFLFYVASTIAIIILIGALLLTAYFYPFSLWWYRRSFIGRMLNGVVHIGSFWAVIGKVLATLVGGVAIAGVLAPIMGPLTLRKCKKKQMIIGDEDDF